MLVAGCGSTGGAAVEPLVRLGVQHLVLADNGAYELNNLNRQIAYQDDIGRNKARVCAERVVAINPYCSVDVEENGLHEGELDDIVARCDVVIDAIDVTESVAWRAKFALHASAVAHRLPVITGYDMAGTQYVRFYDYRRGGVPFDGRITAAALDGTPTWVLLRRVIPIRRVPIEMLEDARRSLGVDDYAISQVVYASLLFGALASRMVVDVLDGRRVRRHVVVDAHGAVRPALANIGVASRKPLVMLLALKDLLALKNGGTPRG